MNNCTNSGFWKLLKDLAVYEIFGASETFLDYKNISTTSPEVVRLKQMDAVMHYKSYYAQDAPQTKLLNTINAPSHKATLHSVEFGVHWNCIHMKITKITVCCMILDLIWFLSNRKYLLRKADIEEG